MPRESIITIYRSIDATIPTGLTFGEFGFAGANRQLFIGGTGGGATVQSIWIGASITGTAISDVNGSGIWLNGNDSQYTLSTTKAVKAYIDAAVGVDGVVTSVNGDTGAITITGAPGGTGAIVVRETGTNTHFIDARIATNSLTGVASFTNGIFSVTNGAVNLESNTLRVRGSDNSTFDSVIIENYTAQDPLTLTITGSAGIYTSVTEGVDAGRNNNPQVTIYHTGVFSSGLSATGITANSVFTNRLTATNASFAGGVTFTGIPVFSSGLSATGITANSVFTNRFTATNASFASGVTFTGVSVFSSGLSATGITANTVFANSIVGTNASFASGVTFTGTPVFSSGLSATGITANTVFANNATFTNATFTNDVTVTGNLTVQGDVVTANVSTITVEDPLIRLANNNTTDDVDIGFYGQYQGPNTDLRYTGFFRDQNDGGKYKLFTGLTAGFGFQPTATVNTGGAGYAIATLVAKLDGGTF